MLSTRALWLLTAFGLCWSGCYGTSSSAEDEGGGGSTSGSGGKSSGGSQNSAGKGGKASGGNATAGTTAAGSGGEPGEAGAPSGGSGGTAGAAPNPMSCDVPYAGPVAGPRATGPEPINLPCASVTDEQILARYDDNDAKVPQGSFWEPPPGAIWAEPCSASLEDTAANAAAAGLGEPEAEYETDWFYEATTCDGGQRRFYRNLRCDYFDGMTLANGNQGVDGQALAFLASLLWWQDNFNVTGNQLLGYSIAIGDATDWVEVCTIRTVYGDFGLCDEITLESTSHTIFFPGEVTLGEPEVVRTIQGDCH